MKYLLLIIIILCAASQNFISKQYNIKVKSPNIFIYTSIVSFCALLFFVISSGGKLNFNLSVLWYSAAFAVSYGMALFGSIYAIYTGPLSITALINQCSLIIPTLFGVIILKDNINTFGYAGIILLFAALFMVNAKNEKMKISSVWFLWVTVGFIGNGMCSTVQKIQQLRYNGAYKNEFMIIALLIVSAVTFIAGCIKNKELKKSIVESIKYAPLQGFANGITNLLVMILTALLPTALLFSSISAGGIVITFIIALLVYKEKLSKMQITGYIAGMFSVILLNF